MFILLSSISRQEISVALLEKLKENRRESSLVLVLLAGSLREHGSSQGFILAALRKLMKQKHSATITMKKHFPSFGNVINENINRYCSWVVGR